MQDLTPFLPDAAQGCVGGGGNKGKAATKEPTTVIGRPNDLKKLNQGEQSLLDRLPNRGNPKDNWKQNSGVLRKEMNRGLPIRDASPNDNGGPFLNAERNLLKSKGWKVDDETGLWMPPPKPR